MAKHPFYATITNGQITGVTPAVQWRDWKSSHEGEKIEMVVKLAAKDRSSKQNRYYWGVVVEMTHAGLNHLGHLLEKEEAHDLLRLKFLKETIVNEDTGEVLGDKVRSSANLTTKEFMEYLGHIQQWAAEYLGIDIPDPVKVGVEL